MSIRALLATVTVSVLLPASAQTAETLTMKFKEGETFGYLITQNMNVAGQVQGNDVQTEMGQTMSISTKIMSVGEDGSAKAAQMIDRVQMKMVLPAPISQTIEYDTDSEEEPDNPIIKQVAANLSKMVGEAISMTISPSGEMTDVEIPESVKQAQQVPGSPVGGADQLEQMFKQSGLRLPKEQISEGHKWDQKMEMKLPFGTMHITTNYVYGGKNEDGLHKIDATMDVNLEPAENAPVEVTAETKEANGTFLFDNDAGRLTKSVIKQELEMTIGDVARQNITTHVTMTLTDGSNTESTNDE